MATDTVETDTDRYFSEPRGIVLLWIGMLAPPLAWALHLQTSYSLAYFLCDTGWEFTLHVVGAVSLSIVIVAGVIAWRSWRLAGPTWEARGGRPVDRSRFMAASGVLLSVFFFLTVVAQWIPTLLISPCH